MIRMLAALAALMIAAPAARPENVSRLLSVEIRSVAADGTYRGVDYVKVAGTVHGQVDGAEAVVGLDALPKNSGGAYEYAADFELIVPARGQSANPVIYIDAENRGRAISQGALGGFLQNNATSYGRVQWQSGIAAGVPETAQGVGLVIVRDFARWLGGRTPQTRIEGDFAPGAYDTLILGGISQSAWFVNTFVAEGFNVDPQARGAKVFDGAIAIDGAGLWLAINTIAAGRGVADQKAYLDPDGTPLSRKEILSRGRADPLFVDVANYTDFYRLRAGLTSRGTGASLYRRYDFPAMHVAGLGLSNPRCNDGVRVEQNPIGYAPYMRALVLGLEKDLGVKSARHAHRLPVSRLFRLAKEQPPASPHFNPLPGVMTPVPQVDGDGMPVGGVRFPESVAPIGRPEPVSLSPAVTSDIAATCGNSGGFQPYGRAYLNQRYGSRERFLAYYSDQIERLIRQGFLLAEDRPAMISAASDLYSRWP